MLRAILKIEKIWQFPGAFGGVDGCQVPIKCPHGGNETKNITNLRTSIPLAKFFMGQYLVAG